MGLAAPQIGKDLRLFVVDIWWSGSGTTENALVFINPEVKELTTQWGTPESIPIIDRKGPYGGFVD